MATDSGEETGRDTTRVSERAAEYAARDAVRRQAPHTAPEKKDVTEALPGNGAAVGATVLRMPMQSEHELDAALVAARASGADAVAREGARGRELIVRERGDGSSVRAATEAAAAVRQRTAFERECMDMQEAARAMAGDAAPAPVQERSRSL
ncbi:MAG: hypothetical protein UHI81_01125 [Olegusella sp.]|nr:hypothetical protein [Olegusella sp.]